MITYKLWRVNRRMGLRGPGNQYIGKRYTSIVSILAESAALYTTASVIYLVLFNVNSVHAFWFLDVVYVLAVRFLVFHPLSALKYSHRFYVRLGSSCVSQWEARMRWADDPIRLVARLPRRT
jgi:hypothetical protein